MSSVLKRDWKTSHASPNVTADKLAKFFADKVEGVHTDTNSAPPLSFVPHDGPKFLTSTKSPWMTFDLL